jgi:hypothetical protein
VVTNAIAHGGDGLHARRGHSGNARGLMGYQQDMDERYDDQVEVSELFDDVADGLACRVCGALVPSVGAYARAHWDWHEAANGA